jgi:hypothetical protein
MAAHLPFFPSRSDLLSYAFQYPVRHPVHRTANARPASPLEPPSGYELGSQNSPGCSVPATWPSPEPRREDGSFS